MDMKHEEYESNRNCILKNKIIARHVFLCSLLQRVLYTCCKTRESLPISKCVVQLSAVIS